MTDAELIVALGWQPCERKRRFVSPNTTVADCGLHGYVAWPDDAAVCSVQAERLALVRAGIDLARSHARLYLSGLVVDPCSIV